MSKISELSDGGVIQGGDTLIAVRSGGNVKVTYGGSTTANIDGGTIDGTTIGGTTPAAGNFTTGSFTGNVSFGDNDKAIFGAGSDLQIYHDGANSYVADEGTGVLNLKGDIIRAGLGNQGYFDFLRSTYTAGSDGLRIGVGSANQHEIKSLGNRDLVLERNDDEKLRLTSTGVDVTGTVTADGLTVDGDAEVQGLRIDAVADVELEFGYANTTHSKIIGDIVTASPTAGQLKFQTSTGGTLYERMRIATNGDISFFEDTGITAKLEWDSSEESLTIGGGSTTQQTLRVTGAHASALSTGFDNQVVKVVNTSASKLAGIDFVASNTNGDAGTIARIGGFNTSSASYLGELTLSTRDGTGMVERVRIDDSGNVGIGTDSPLGVLSIGDHTNTSGTTSDVYISGDQVNADDYYARLMFRNSNQSGGSTASIRAERLSNNNGTGLTFYTNGTFSAGDGSERMRLDYDGNLLVGTTNANPTSSSVNDSGVELSDTGGVRSTVASNPAATFNRKTDDGNVVLFRKDGTTVGSIGSHSGGGVYLHSNAGSDSGLAFWSNVIAPSTSAGAYRDAAIDLGASGGRFKDLYLSGGAYLGGTGSANHLDDYEEGDYDATITTGTSGTVTLNGSFNRLSYTKIGRSVHISGFIVVSSVSSPVGYFKINLPFTPANLTDRAADSTACLVIQGVASANIADFTGSINEADANLYVQLGNSNTIQNNSAQQLQTNTYLSISATYNAA